MDAKLRSFTDSLPKFADGLYRDARNAARSLFRNHTPNPLLRVASSLATMVTGCRPTKETALANCIFDLQLTVLFAELSKYFGNKEIVSLLVDAFLYQATGCETGDPSSEELLFLGTQNTRGIEKYRLAQKEKPHIGDIQAWTFGKEFGAIIYGIPLDIAHILSVSPFSMVARVRARWHIRYLLYGTSPTKQDEEELLATLKEQEKNLRELTHTSLTNTGHAGREGTSDKR
jgi:hypothetical protein